ncbi:hypothetical protein RFI_38858 [Reticulomyxa filosa]|uniref:Uncharacterized protein n=1 Tax=Reticulomyxa filosa TaxID=46433 RepID=X6LCZ4_RETFI|nr:hypothetical protein RFI_38858 [Reticulomyxa filosa]|eukprot:ETN98634.1 hypothetical protein RFI_38858 [Reticulomyxa filosa]
MKENETKEGVEVIDNNQTGPAVTSGEEDLWTEFFLDVKKEHQKAKDRKEAAERDGLFGSMFRSFRRESTKASAPTITPSLARNSFTEETHKSSVSTTLPSPFQTTCSPHSANAYHRSNVIKGTVQLPPLRDSIQHIDIYDLSNVSLIFFFLKK